MKVLRAKTGGFCMGVALALRKLDEALVQCSTLPQQGRLVMLGPIIHNPQVLAEYAAQGVVRADSLDAVRAQDIVVIRAHGIPCQEEIRLQEVGAVVIDATCPKVKRAQLAIAEATMGGKPLYLFGEREHPEVRGLVSYAQGACHVFGTLEELQEGEAIEAEAVLAAQTTQERTLFIEIEQWLGKRSKVNVLSTICDATKRRQQEAESIAKRVEGMVVVGGRESGNTRRLADVVRSCGVPAWLVETADEVLLLEALRKMRVVGITAGASTPKSLIDNVQSLLEDGQING